MRRVPTLAVDDEHHTGAGGDGTLDERRRRALRLARGMAMQVELRFHADVPPTKARPPSRVEARDSAAEACAGVFEDEAGRLRHRGLGQYISRSLTPRDPRGPRL